eukprot:2770551-Prymnesium_polylepis.1
MVAAREGGARRHHGAAVNRMVRAREGGARRARRVRRARGRGGATAMHTSGCSRTRAPFAAAPLAA